MAAGGGADQIPASQVRAELVRRGLYGTAHGSEVLATPFTGRLHRSASDRCRPDRGADRRRKPTRSRGAMRSPFVHEWFTSNAAAAGDLIAIDAGPRTLTYAELDRRSNGLAHALTSVVPRGTLV